MNCISSFGDSATAAIRDNPSSASMNPDTEEKLITIYIHDGDLCSVRALCACVLALYSRSENTVNTCVRAVRHTGGEGG